MAGKCVGWEGCIGVLFSHSLSDQSLRCLFFKVFLFQVRGNLIQQWNGSIPDLSAVKSQNSGVEKVFSFRTGSIVNVGPSNLTR